MKRLTLLVIALICSNSFASDKAEAFKDEALTDCVFAYIQARTNLHEARQDSYVPINSLPTSSAKVKFNLNGCTDDKVAPLFLSLRAQSKESSSVKN